MYKDENMTEPTTSIGGVFMLKAYGIKAGLGMMAAVILFLALPPVDKDGTFNEREFVFRLFVAGISSMIFGDWLIAIIDQSAPYLLVKDFPAPIYFLVGAPGWWLSRAFALWFKRNEGRDIEQFYDHIKSKRNED